MSKKILLKSWLSLLMAFVPFITQAQTTTLVEWNFDSPYEFVEGDRIATPSENGTIAAVGDLASTERLYITYPDLPNIDAGVLTAKGADFYNSVQLSDCNGVSTVRLYYAGQNSITDYSNGDNHDNYFQFSLSTLGYEDIKAEFSFAGNTDSSTYMELAYSPDGGTTWIDAGSYERHDNWWIFTDYSEALNNAKNKEELLVRLMVGNDAPSERGAINLNYFRVTGTEISDDSYQERIVYATDFQDWDANTVSTTPIEVTKKTSQNKDLTFSLASLQVVPNGVNDRFTSEIVTTGYIMTEKNKDVTAPDNGVYIQSSVIESVTSITFVQAATGGTRGLTLSVKGDGDDDWVYIHNKAISTSAGEKLVYDINRKNVQIRFGSFDLEQNGYLLALEIKGMVEISEPQSTLSTSVYPEGAGTIKQNPNGIEFDQGTKITLTAERSFGYGFVRWVDGNGNEISTENPYTFDLNQDMEIRAEFEELTLYSFALNTTGYANDYLVSVSPAGEVRDGVTYYEAGSEIQLIASNNKILTFLYWENDNTQSTRTLAINEDTEVTAHYSEIDFIVGWDFHMDEPKKDRPGDYIYDSENQGKLVLHKADGTESGWLAKGISGGMYEGRYAAVNWQPFTNNDNYYYEISFSTANYINVEVHAAMLLNFNAFKVQKVEYSIDGENFKQIGYFELSEVKTWYEESFALPEETWKQDKVYVRFIADYNSPILGAESDKDGTGITDIFVVGEWDEDDDPVAPALETSKPENGGVDVSATGSIILNFDKRVYAGTESCTLNGEVLEATFAGKSVSFRYTGLDYNTEYTFVIPANAIVNKSGVGFEGTEIKFTTIDRTQPAARVYDVVVAADGSGDYVSVQEAITAAPENRVSPYLIFIKNGTYKEHVEIPATKPYIYLIGQDVENVIITDDQLCGGEESVTGKPALHVRDGATVVVQAANFYAENISFENSWGIEKNAGPQALALYTNNDRIILNNCKLRSYQDTYLTSTKNVTDRHYLKNCFIEGAVDFIYGAGDVFFDECDIYITRTSGGYIVAPSHKVGTAWGYVFMNNTISAPAPAISTSVWLGRPWKDAPKTVFINTVAEVTIPATGWYETMGAIPHTFADYNTMNAQRSPMDLSERRSYYYYTDNGQKVEGYAKHSLTAEEVAEYTIKNVLSGDDAWQPTLVTEPVSAPILTGIDGKMTWPAVPYAMCYVITKDGEVVEFTTETSYTVPSGVPNGAIYTVQAANEFGGLSAMSGKYEVGSTGIEESTKDQIAIYGGVERVVVEGISIGAQIQVYNMNGILVKSLVADSNVDFPVNKGSYIVKVVANEGVKSSVVIVR